MQAAMGHQDVRIFGIPSNSRFACKLVAADYRLKRVAMGFDRPPVRGLLNYMDLLARSGKQAVQRQHRFWFVATHDRISRSPDGHFWHLSGSGLEVRTAVSGTPRKPSASETKTKAAPAARRLAANLTRSFPELVKHIPVFGELENLIRLTVAAEIAVNAPLTDTTTRWSSLVLGDPERYRTQTTLAPKRVPSLAAVRKARGRNWIFSVSGGIALQPPPVQLRSFGTLDRQLAARIRSIQGKPNPTDKSWWWD
jgi:hypothetical protein